MAARWWWNVNYTAATGMSLWMHATLLTAALLLLRLCVCRMPCTQLPPGAVDVEILHDATRREARGG